MKLDHRVLFVVFFLAFLVSPLKTDASTETIRIYPTDDAVAQLYNDDGISGWDEARNFQGEIYREPITTGSLDNTGNIYVRSDKGAGYYRIYRVSKVFDLSSLPEGAVITGARLGVYKTLPNNSGNIEVVVTSHQRKDVNFMQKQDWIIDSFGTDEFSRKKLLEGEYTHFDFNQSGIVYLNDRLDNLVTIGLLTEFDFDNKEPIGNILSAGWYEVEKEGQDYDPYLQVEYTFPQETRKYPLYTQIKSPYPSEVATAEWADDTMPCGTIATCGCAITSMVMMARANGVTEGVDGKDVNPGNLNAWLKDNKGYSVGGGLKWEKALEYFGTKNMEGKTATPFALKHFYTASSSLVKAALSEGPRVVGHSESISHYFLLTKQEGSTYMINDPWYYETKTLDDVDTEEFVFDYNNFFDKAHIFSFTTPQVLTNFIDIVLASPAELRLVNEAGAVTGYDQVGNRAEVPFASYDPEEYIGDQANLVSPEERHYIKRMIVTEAGGKYVLEVIGTGVGEYSLGISFRDNEGDEHVGEFMKNTQPGQVDRYEIDVVTGTLTEVKGQGDGENDEEDEGDGEASEHECEAGKIPNREAFMALVRLATKSERGSVQRFFIREAERLFDALEERGGKHAQARWRTYGTLLTAKQIKCAPLRMAWERLENKVEQRGG